MEIKKIVGRICMLCLICFVFCGCTLSRAEWDRMEERKRVTRVGQVARYCERWGERVSNDVKTCMLDGIIKIGMTKTQVRISWGEPSDINESVGSWGVHEQWVYHRGSGPYLYFENGKLTSWQH